MIGELSYDEINDMSSNISKSSIAIREVIDKYDDLNDILDFCDTMDAYAKFLETTVGLYKDSDEALRVIIEKNK